MIELEGLQVWPIADGAEGRVVLEWVELDSDHRVPARNVTLVIARAEAANLAKRIQEALDA